MASLIDAVSLQNNREGKKMFLFNFFPESLPAFFLFVYVPKSLFTEFYLL